MSVVKDFGFLPLLRLFFHDPSSRNKIDATLFFWLPRLSPLFLGVFRTSRCFLVCRSLIGIGLFGKMGIHLIFDIKVFHILVAGFLNLNPHVAFRYVGCMIFKWPIPHIIDQEDGAGLDI
jgi:hypothetical protein